MSTAYTKYGGFRPMHVVDAAIPYPPVQGSRAFVDSKFHAPNRAEPPPDASGTALLASVFTAATTTVRPGDYKPPERKLGLQVLPMEKPAWQDSTTHEEYPYFPALAEQLLSVSEEALEKGWQAYNATGEGFILPKEMRGALREALGHEPNPCQVMVLEGLVSRYELARIPLPAWLQLVRDGGGYIKGMLDSQTPAVLSATNAVRLRMSGRSISPSRQATQEEKKEEGGVDLGSTAGYEAVAASSARSDGSAGKRMLTAGPLGTADLSLRGLHTGQMRNALLTASASMRGEGKGSSVSPATGPSSGGESFRLRGPALQSSFERDVGVYGSNPRERPVREGHGILAGHPQTTAGLSVGTTRMASHVPGYMGHVPSELSSTAAQQGLGQTARNTFHANNDLTATFSAHVTGYGGHVPAHVLTGHSAILKPRGAAATSDYDHGMGHIEGYWASVQMSKEGQ